MISKNDLTICLVIHNEEAMLPRCLNSVKNVSDNIFVIHDGECKDKSLEICRKHGAKVIIQPHIGEAEPHRAWQYSQVHSQWILQLDADEFLSDELQAELPKLVKQINISCYEFIWPHWNGNRYITKNWPTKKALFQPSKIEFLGTPHEEVRPKGRVIRTHFVLEHRPLGGNHNLKEIRSKWMRWAKVHAQYFIISQKDLPHFPESASNLRPHYDWIRQKPLRSILFVLPYHFLGGLLTGGLKEGLAGIKISLFNAFYYALVCYEVSKLKQEHAKN